MSKLPSTGKVIGIFAAVVVLVVAAFYIFQYRINHDENTLTDGVPNNVGENIPNTSAEKDKAVDWYETNIAKLESRKDEMQKKAIESSDEVKKHYDESISNIDKELDSLRIEMKQMREATNENWEVLKTKLEQTRERVESKLKNDPNEYSALLPITLLNLPLC